MKIQFGGFDVHISEVIISILVLHETLTWMSVLGMALSLAGLFISEHRGKGRKNKRISFSFLVISVL